MLSAKMTKALNEQIAMENNASAAYLAMASWANQKGLQGTAQFFYRQSDEERMHMLKLFHYVNDMGGAAVVSAAKAPATSYPSLRTVFETALENEHAVTHAIHTLVDLANATKDHATSNFLQWYVSEQREEEARFCQILDTIKLLGKDPRADFFADREIGQMAPTSAASNI